jgi:hypothetical protein
MDKPRILVEVGDLGLDETWDCLLDAAMTRQFRSSGMSKAQAKDASKKLVTEWRTNFGNLRL